ncbi:MAG TPA: NAD(P)-dependent glycerol-3-phosphate dehydrogenase [Deltaproteobacteria bacterium]|nr:NAD(P)-dependent glycerol-3-phosphate dehydrogenase [Deltaproteobacteria bacterium]
MTGSVTVIGGGSWGTTLANLLAEKGLSVRLWVRSNSLCELIREKRENPAYLKGVRLSDNILPTTSIKEALEDSPIVVCAVPSHGIRAIFTEASQYIRKDAIIVSTSKGIEEGTHLTCSAILKECLDRELHQRVVVLSGPSFAGEVSRGLPTAVCVAGIPEYTESIQRLFSTPSFRVYTNPDMTGVELGGALKNVVAIASGISDGLGLGNNARAALITRGLKEMVRLGVECGAEEKTFYGLSGMGDLVLTCTGELSRNRKVGLEIGKGKTLGEVLSGMKMVAEGVRTSRSVRELARVKGVDMPITEQVYNILYESKSPRDAVMELMTRRLKEE